jgi:ADP-ribosylglycohydrolase
MSPSDVSDHLTGTLLGTALGDALGLPCEGLSAPTIARRFGSVDRFRLLGRTGFVSDDTEQSALVAQSLTRHPHDVDACVRSFRRSLLGWFSRLPWGVGLATVRACVRIALGLKPTGVMSAGNGAAMRSAIIGSFFHDQPEPRREFAKRLALVTHRDDRAVEGAVFVAEVAAACVCNSGPVLTASALAEARRVVTNPQLGEALDRAFDLASQNVDIHHAAEALGNSGFVVHTVPFALYGLLTAKTEPLDTLTQAISAGGDTDSIGAILGGWLGARHGESGLPAALIHHIHDGPFGPTHLRRLATCLASTRSGHSLPIPSYSPTAALARNLALYPVVLAHGFRRLIPF